MSALGLSAILARCNMLYSWEKRKVVYMSPWIAGLCVLVVAAFLFWMNRDLVHGWKSRVSAAQGSELGGEWVGSMEIYGYRDPLLSEIHKKAALRFDLKVTDSVVGKYGGMGKLMIEGEKEPRSIEVVRFDPQPTRHDGSFDTEIWCNGNSWNKFDKRDNVSGDFQGVFKAPTLFIERQEGYGYQMKGVLRKGSDEDFRKLAQQIQQPG
jgi:hypothetical protein